MKRSAPTSASPSAAPAKQVRCAIYTRKSTEEGLQQEFNTLDAQRESAEAYVAAHRHEGWVPLEDRYDDGGYSGGTMDRPAFNRLMADVEAGKVDAILVYKIDRLSRSLRDFVRIIEVLERRNVALISITQALDTKTSMGRLTLNILLSFAQFEREMVSERTSDKIAATRRKGRFSGGRPLLGYDIVNDASGARLVVNAEEAALIRRIYGLYIKHEALIPTVRDINARGWTLKRYVTRSGKPTGGSPWTKESLFRILTNVTYTGRVKHRTNVYDGQHEAIVEPEVFQRVNAILRRNRVTGGALVRNKYGALLKGVLHCGPCRCSMGHAYTMRGNVRHRYYACLIAQQRGYASCPSRTVPAAEIEAFVVGQVRGIGRDPRVLAAATEQAQRLARSARADLEAEVRQVERELGREGAEVARAAGARDAAALAQAQDRAWRLEARLSELRSQAARPAPAVDVAAGHRALADFAPVWDALSPKEQARIIRLLVERVVYDGAEGTIAVTFRPNGIEALAAELRGPAA